MAYTVQKLATLSGVSVRTLGDDQPSISSAFQKLRKSVNGGIEPFFFNDAGKSQ